MRKVGFLCLALVLVLGGVGVAFAKWSETLTISGVVNTGEVDVEFSNQLSNDPTGSGMMDEAEFGRWNFGVPPVNDPTLWRWIGDRYDKDVASIDCELINQDGDPQEGGSTNDGNEAMAITVTNGYPSYYGSIAFTIDNIGTIPVKIESIKLTQISKGTVVVTVDVDLVACTVYYVDVDDQTVDPGPVANPDDYEFSIHLSELAVGQQIDPRGSAAGPDFIVGDIGVHVEQDADELTTYDFVISIVASQWNEVP